MLEKGIYKKVISTGFTVLIGIGIGIGICKIVPENIIRKHNQDNAIQTENAEQLVTDKIAIVNLDEGVWIQDEKINYAAKLLTDLQSNFLITGLEDARQGYELGIYGGYLIIPATFSESVLSLNDVPIRAEVSYAISSELREDVKEQVIYDTMNLVADLNSKVSYIYMHAVMDEFHDAQDEANIVMNNDLAERDAINDIRAEDLVALIPISGVTQIPYEIEPVDISDYMQTNSELVGLVGEKYTEYIKASEVEHEKINIEATDLMTEMGNMDAIISGIDFAHDQDGNPIYEKGAEDLEVLFIEHNDKVYESQQQISQNVIANYCAVQNYLKQYERAMNQYQIENEQKYLNTLNALQQLVDNYESSYVLIPKDELQILQQVQTLSEQEEVIFEESVQLTQLQLEMQRVLESNYYIFSGYLLDDAGNAITDEKGNNIEITSLLEKYNIDLGDERIRSEMLQQEVGDIELMDISEVINITEQEVLQPIQENVDAVTQQITEQYGTEKEQLADFQTSVVEYNPLKYIDYEEIGELTTKMFENGSSLSQAIAETDEQQMEYVASVYEATRTDISNLQDDIEQAKEDSDLTIAEGLQDLKDIKNQNSITNQQIMLDFSEKLPYTRLGSLEYTQVYEFMIDPVVSADINQSELTRIPANANTIRTDKESVKTHTVTKYDREIIGMLISVMLCGIIVFLTIKYHFHKNKIPDYKGL